MGKWKFIAIALIAIIAFYGFKLKVRLYKVPPKPALSLRQYWGPGPTPTSMDETIKRFEIKFDPDRLANLLASLDNTEFYTEPLETNKFEYGLDSNVLKYISTFWKTSYNITEREVYLNTYPQFKTNIQGLDIHYIHVKPNVEGNIKIFPLLMLHGWPGSIREYFDLIPLMTTPKEDMDFVFELIIPSLPGFGYSQGASKVGLGPAHIAVIMRNLMERLGFDKYLIHGGDWGSVIGSNMATLYPDKVLGYHTNTGGIFTELSILKIFLGSLIPSFIYDNNESPLMEIFNFFTIEGGYAHIQATKPESIGAALKLTPLGLAGYIIEKFASWTSQGHMHSKVSVLLEKISLRDLLDNVMIYWSSGCITTSMRIYAEYFNKNELKLMLDNIPIRVPTAIALFKNDVIHQSNWEMSEKYLNIVQMNKYKTGGHFAAMELPELFANDIWSAVSKFKILPNKSD